MTKRIDPTPADSRWATIDMFATALQESGAIESSFLPGGEDLLASLMLTAAREMGARSIRIVINYERNETGRISCLVDGAIA